MGSRGRESRSAPREEPGHDAGSSAGPGSVRGAGGEEARTLPTRVERRRLARRVARRRRRSRVIEVPLLLVFALLIALFLKTFLVQAFVIPSGSMEQTIKIGDRVLVDKLTPWFHADPERGDVVVFKDPGNWLGEEGSTTTATGSPPVGIKQAKELLTFIGLLPSADEQDLIKRVVAVGGDTVKCCGKDGRLTVNGVAVDEPYLNPGDVPSAIQFEVKVPRGRIFVMGDHRSNSADSRFHMGNGFQGTVPLTDVVGRAVVTAWPVGSWTSLGQRDAFSGVPDASAGTSAAPALSHSVSHQDPYGMIPLPTPAELPLVMGVMGLRRIRRGRWHGLRSGCGGFGGRRTIRTRRTRGPARTERGPLGDGGGPDGG
ncbi:signal peptidase I [Streptomyces sp. NBC_01218]|uniref:signal peptidase I n=1 Tax=unclassified Streptomyces TaxID=2593676 RepID=UPI0023B96E33|nr:MULTISPECIES: signal peptidase I [unclassified Streptomyces]WEH39430.1 signal peptidase I [Streptomyces sp. AM 2-1-1]WSQ51128.1 signal peptidase I [Streptomyces sp. NBC_01218]